MNKTPMVSVIIAIKNEEKNIRRLLKSVRRQTYKNLEVIVVDNNSTDQTKRIAGHFTKKVFNKGPERSAQRNFGVKKARGKFVLILDADMELTAKVVESCINNIDDHKALIIPERTVGKSFVARVRAFERAMYMGDPSIEVARFFERKIFNEFGGYDLSLTGPEDYDLPYRISKRYSIGRATKYILHHEEDMTIGRLLRKKFYYARKGARYARKHPELVATQGNLLFRKAYFRNWKKFVENPLLGLSFIFVRALEATWAVGGYISEVGFRGLTRTLLVSLNKQRT